ncbi:hypothetical protein LP419_14020 [Massilia sp. H-1]|nr:hypothetical protein LP419_14020 [Massilia sp. H-1]
MLKHGDAGRGRRQIPRRRQDLSERHRSAGKAPQPHELDAVLANRSEIESVMRGDPAYPLHDVNFQRLPRLGWAVGMAVRKDDTEMAKLLQAALNEMA